MATNPDSTPTPAPTVPLWPAPVFVLGVGALVAVALCRPLFPANPARLVHQDLASARAQLAKPDGDVDRAIELARRALERAEQLPDRDGAGDASHVLGTAYIRLAEKAPGVQAKELWDKARGLLEQAEQSGVTEDDKPMVSFRLAKVGFHSDAPPLDEVIQRLEDSGDLVEPRAEAYDLLTRAYLRDSSPNLDRAIAANQKLREVADLSGVEMAQAQLTGSELLLRQGKSAEAIKSLVLIIDAQQVPPATLVRARLLLARCHLDERRHEQAIAHYKEALADRRAPIDRPAQVYYNLGLCYQRLGQTKEAAEAWKKSTEYSVGNETQAAGIVLAEALLLDRADESVLKALEDAVKGIESAQKWSNPLVDLSRVREVFERAIDSFRKAGLPDLALKALEPYTRLAVPRRLLEWRGSLSAEVAKTKKSKNEPGGEAEITALFRQAADAYSQAAGLKEIQPNEVADYLWAAVPCHLAGGESVQATMKLETLTSMKLEPARMGESWYLLGEEYRRLGDKKAVLAYRECMKHLSRFEYLARYQLAMLLLAAGDYDEAMAALRANISQLRYDNDNESHAQSLLALGGILYRQGGKNFREAARHLEEGLAKSRDKNQAELAWPRYHLADSYRQIAAQENLSQLLKDNPSQETREHFQREHNVLLLKAAEEFSSLDTFLISPEGKNCLTKELRSSIPFVTAKCWFNIGKYEKALKVYDRLIDQFKGSAEGLDALGGAVACHAELGQVGMVRQRLLQIEQAIEPMPPEVSKPWAEWLKEARKGLKDI